MFEAIYWALVIAVLGLAFIAVCSIIAMGVWLYAAYKWITRSKWEGKTPRGNRRV